MSHGRWAAAHVVLPPGLARRDVEPGIREVMEQGWAGLDAFREPLLAGALCVG